MTIEAEPARTAALPPGFRTLLNIPRWTLGLGFIGAAVALLLQRSDWATGILSGAVLGWLDFRWLRRGTSAMLAAPENRSRSAVFAAFLALFRYVLIALVAYVIFRYLHVPLVSIAVGLCALGAATITASVWEILRPAK